MQIKHIAVLGAGTMGNGIAQVAATAGFTVILFDIQQIILDRAIGHISKSLGRLVEKERLSAEQAQATQTRIRTTLDLKDACKRADMVIEAAPEKIELKKEIFSKVERITSEQVILATNTSNLSVTALAASTGRADKFIGMHWFNPPPIMKLIELVVGLETSQETLKITRQVAEKMGKTTIVCRDSQGFITTRALTAFLVECYRIYEEGLACAEDIDEAIRLGLNHPMGPLQLSDYIGLDTIQHISKSLVEAFGERFRLPQSVVNMVRAGRHGVKAGRGFYRNES